MGKLKLLMIFYKFLLHFKLYSSINITFNTNVLKLTGTIKRDKPHVSKATTDRSMYFGTQVLRYSSTSKTTENLMICA